MGGAGRAVGQWAAVLRRFLSENHGSPATVDLRLSGVAVFVFHRHLAVARGLHCGFCLGSDDAGSGLPSARQARGHDPECALYAGGRGGLLLLPR